MLRVFGGSLPPAPDSTMRFLAFTVLTALSACSGPGSLSDEALSRPRSQPVSSEELAARGQTTAAQVRKDLSHFGSFGKRGLGYRVDELRDRLRAILGIDRSWRVALAGAGRIGRALFEYPAFRSRGYECVAIFDADPGKIGQRWGEQLIRSSEDLERTVDELGVELVILALPADAVLVGGELA